MMTRKLEPKQCRRWRRRIPWFILIVFLLYGRYVDWHHSKVIDQHIKQLHNRHIWMMAISDYLLQQTSDRWRIENERKAWEEFFRENENSEIPENFHPYSIVPDKLSPPEIPE